jgi:hypothetical protein
MESVYFSSPMASLYLVMLLVLIGIVSSILVFRDTRGDKGAEQEEMV